MDEQALNKKLAEWAGFEKQAKYSWRSPWQNRRAFVTKSPPNFAQSLDACFRWLVPKLEYPILLSSAVGIDNVIRYSCLIEVYGVHPSEYDVVNIETPALALCLTIEKLIDKEEQR